VCTTCTWHSSAVCLMSLVRSVCCQAISALSYLPLLLLLLLLLLLCCCCSSAAILHACGVLPPRVRTQIRSKANHLGGCIDPHAAFLLQRGLKTLALRVTAQSATACALARLLQAHALVCSSGASSHPVQQTCAAVQSVATQPNAYSSSTAYCLLRTAEPTAYSSCSPYLPSSLPCTHTHSPESCPLAPLHLPRSHRWHVYTIQACQMRLVLLWLQNCSPVGVQAACWHLSCAAGRRQQMQCCRCGHIDHE
jgi:Cys/Met metabolism PLP-dependent enzyme